MKTGDYLKDRDAKYIAKLKENEQYLPQLCRDYFTRISSRTPSYRALSSSCLRIFFTWLYNQDENHKDPTTYTLEDIAAISSLQISAFKEMLKDEKHDSPNTIQNYLSSISAFYKHLNKLHIYEINPVDEIERKKRDKSSKVFLRNDDFDRFNSTVSAGVGLTKHELQYREAIGTTERDILICALLVNTGIRISELVAIDLDTIDRRHHCFRVIRKGEKKDNYVYYSDEIENLLEDYIPKRNKILAEGETALFLSFTGKTKGKRIDVRTIQKMIKKYAMAAGVADADRMSPHKLRHTSAMMLLSATGNLALVKKFLGHEHISSTTIYAESLDDDLIAARNIIQT